MTLPIDCFVGSDMVCAQVVASAKSPGVDHAESAQNLGGNLANTPVIFPPTSPTDGAADPLAPSAVFNATFNMGTSKVESRRLRKPRHKTKAPRGSVLSPACNADIAVQPQQPPPVSSSSADESTAAVPPVLDLPASKLAEVCEF